MQAAGVTVVVVTCMFAMSRPSLTLSNSLWRDPSSLCSAGCFSRLLDVVIAGNPDEVQHVITEEGNSVLSATDDLVSDRLS
jgi:hypothetical protein